MKKVLFSALAVMALTASVFAAGVRTKGPSDSGGGPGCVPTIPIYVEVMSCIGPDGKTFTNMVLVGFRC